MRYTHAAKKYLAFPFVVLILLLMPLAGKADALTVGELLSHYQEMEAMNQDVPGYKPFRAGIYVGFMHALMSLRNGKDFCMPENVCSCEKTEAIGKALRGADPKACASDVIISALAISWPCKK